MFDRRFSARVSVALASLLGIATFFIAFWGLAQAQSGSSISVAFSPQRSVPPEQELTATFTVNNLEPTAYTPLTLVSTIKRYSRWEAQGANNQPMFSAEDANREVAENTRSGVDLGDPIAATDLDADANLTYSIDGLAASNFTFSPETGQLTTLLPLNYEARTRYYVKIGVSDGKDATGGADTEVDDTIDVYISITNVDEGETLELSTHHPRVGSIIRQYVRDRDGPHLNVEWGWEKSPDKRTWTALDGREHVYTLKAGDLGHYIRASATYVENGIDKSLTATTNGVTRPAAPAVAVEVTDYATGLTIPWDVGFTPDGKMLITERGGLIKVRMGAGDVRVVKDLDDDGDFFFSGEIGLMSILIDSDFATTRQFYTCQTHEMVHEYDSNPDREIQVIAWTINEDYTTATRVKDPLVGDIPAKNVGGGHGGCRLKFGPEGYLWISTGDGFLASDLPQDVDSLAAKVLRVDKTTGEGAPGNPFNSLVYSYGHRNPQGLALRPGTDQMWAVEHGPLYDDEINLLVSGGNYGWNPSDGTGSLAWYDRRIPMTDFEEFPDAIKAKWSSGDKTVANSGAVFLEGSAWGPWEGYLAVAALRSESLRLYEFDMAGNLLAETFVAELSETEGRLRSPVLGPDQALYITTSNGGGADKVLRVAPVQNTAPEFPSSAMTTFQIQENTPATTVLATVAATDDNHAVTYSLSGTDASHFTIADSAIGEIRAKTSLDYESMSSYSVTVTATDPFGESDSIDIIITVTNAQEAGSLRPLSPGSGPKVGAAYRMAFSDSDGVTGPLTWHWDSSPDGSTNWEEISAAVTDTYIPVVGDLGTYLRAHITYSDALGGPYSLEYVSEPVQRQAPPPTPSPPAVNPQPPPSSGGGGGGGGGSSPRNRSPEFRDGSKAERTVSENAPSGALLGDPIEARDSDDDDVLVYSLGGVDAALFAIDPTDGQLGTNAVFDFESRSAYEIIVSVSDGKSSRDRPDDAEDDFIEVTIKVRNADEPGVVTLSNDTPFINSGIAAVLEDADGNLRDIEWSWERSEDVQTWEKIADAAVGMFTPGEEVVGAFLRVTAAYSDVHGSGKTAIAVTNTAVVANTVPGFSTDEPIERAVREHVAGETGGVVGGPVVAADQDGDALTYSLDVDDAALFEIEASSGQISVREDVALNFEERASYSLVVQVRDHRDERGDADLAADDSVRVIVAVKNLDEPGTLRPSLRIPRVGAPFTVELADPDGAVGDVEWRWERSRSIEQGQQSWTPISRPTAASAYSPLATDAGQYLRISATYTDGHGPFKNTQLIVNGAVLDFTGPIFVGADAGSVSLSVEENATGGTAVGEPVTAESGDGQITYTLSGPDAGLFTVDEKSGQIRVADGAQMDYEQDSNSYELTLTATDGLGEAVSVTVLVQLSDVALPGLAGRYDADNNERISRAEALAAVVDYFAGAITKGALDGVLALQGGS